MLSFILRETKPRVLVEAGLPAERRAAAGRPGLPPEGGHLGLARSQKEGPSPTPGPSSPRRNRCPTRLWAGESRSSSTQSAMQTDSSCAWGPGVFITRFIPLAASKRPPGPARLGAFCSNLQGGRDGTNQHTTKNKTHLTLQSRAKRLGVLFIPWGFLPHRPEAPFLF